MKPRAWNSTLPAPTKPMKRSASRSGSHLSRSEIRREAELRSRKPIRPRNPKRAAWKFKRNFHSVDFVEFTHTRPCWPCGSRDRIQAAHILEGRKMGGCGGDWRDVGPQCSDCHDEWGRGVETFLRARGLTWADAERAVAEHQAAWAEYQEAA